jgi:hypothetical protein
MADCCLRGPWSPTPSPPTPLPQGARGAEENVVLTVARGRGVRGQRISHRARLAHNVPTAVHCLHKLIQPDAGFLLDAVPLTFATIRFPTM